MVAVFKGLAGRRGSREAEKIELEAKKTNSTCAPKTYPLAPIFDVEAKRVL